MKEGGWEAEAHRGTAWVGTLAMLAPASVQAKKKNIQLEQSLALHPPVSGASTSLSHQGNSLHFILAKR